MAAKRRMTSSSLAARAVVVAGLVGYVAVVYLVVVALGGLLAPDSPRWELTLTFLAAALVAVSLEPVRQRLRRWRPATAEERLLRLASHTDDSGDLGTWLEQLARLLSDALGSGASVAITATLGGDLTATWQWPRQRSSLGRFSRVRRPIARGPRELGELSVDLSPDRTLTPVEQRLLDDAAAQAGLLIEASRMDQILQQVVQSAAQHYEDLQQSRRRILETMEQERRRVERNIHDGAQQHLVALAVSLRLLRVLLERDPGRAQAKATSLVATVHDAVHTVRQLADGLYPPVLVDQGPAAALRLAAAGSPVPVLVHAEVQRRWSAPVEEAVYFGCLEALQNAIKHADAQRIQVRMVEEPGQLSFEVSDDGRGFDPTRVHRGSGGANLVDRLAAVGGRVQVISAPGAGTTVAGAIPTSEPLVVGG